MKKENKTLTKWKNIIDQKEKYCNAPFTQHEIIYIRKAINNCGLKNSDDREALMNHWMRKMPSEGYNITVDHQQKGINYLINNTFKKNGTLRKNNILGEFEQKVISDFKEFRFVGLFDGGNVHNRFYLPVYRCISNDGSYFDYVGTVYNMIRVLNIESKVA